MEIDYLIPIKNLAKKEEDEKMFEVLCQGLTFQSVI